MKLAVGDFSDNTAAWPSVGKHCVLAYSLNAGLKSIHGREVASITFGV